MGGGVHFVGDDTVAFVDDHGDGGGEAGEEFLGVEVEVASEFIGEEVVGY